MCVTLLKSMLRFYLPITQVVPIVGGLALAKQERQLSYRPEIVVGTPGRLWELISGAHPHFQSLPTLKFLVIDEADRMVHQLSSQYRPLIHGTAACHGAL